MAERMTRYQLAFAPFLNKYINDECLSIMEAEE